MLDKEMLAKRIGAKIKHFRLQLKISQEELAHRCGLNRAYIGYLESGVRTPSIPTLYKIALELKTTMSELVK